MTKDYALGIWRSVKTTFVLFLIVVPVIVVSDILGPGRAKNDWSELVLPAAGLLVFAALVAEVGRRMINFFAGSDICHWRTPS